METSKQALQRSLPTRKEQTVQATLLFSALACIFACSCNGSWLLPVVYVYHHIQEDNSTLVSEDKINESAVILQQYFTFLASNLIISFSLYFPVCLYLQYEFYVKRRAEPEQWKCQPKKFLPPELERHEVLLGSSGILFGSTIFSALATYMHNGGKTFLYMNISDYGWTWFILQIPLHFIYQDLAAYWMHRMLHTRRFYVYHKVHHTYKQPTAFSATAMHPVEFFILQCPEFVPIFTCPIHIGVYFGTLVYMFYYGLVDHSGVMIKPLWPWQPDPIFHDNHHQYTHVNFGFNLGCWDRMFGTERKRDRVYSEFIYGGQGKSLDQATEDELKYYKDQIDNELKVKDQ